MFQRAIVLLVLGCALGLVFATWLAPQPAAGEEAPPELRAAPLSPTKTAKEISRPIIEATRKVRPAVVKILNLRQDRRRRLQQVAAGSGIIVSAKGHILTNRHVVLNADVIQIELADGRRTQRIKVLGVDARSDVAAMKILEDWTDLPIARMGDSDQLEVGELVVAIGAPFELESSVSLGVVSATGRTGISRRRGANEEFIQTDAALNPGNSGGPLVNLDGQVVGMNTVIRGDQVSGTNVGIGFAIPINLARTVAVALIEKGVAKRGWIGMSGGIVTKSKLAREGINSRGGFRIVSVEKDSPAKRAGLRQGQIVTQVDGRPIKDLNTLHARLASAGPGGNVRLTVESEEGSRTVSVKLIEQPLNTFGIEVDTLTAQRARSLGLPEDTVGAVVTKIREKSLADRAPSQNRLLPGDVIVRIDWPSSSKYIRTREQFNAVMELFMQSPPRVVRFVIATKEGLYKILLRPDTGDS